MSDITIPLAYFVRTPVLSPSRVGIQALWGAPVDSISPPRGVPNATTRRADGVRESWVLPPRFRYRFSIIRLEESRGRRPEDPLVADDFRLTQALEFAEAVFLYRVPVSVYAGNVAGVMKNFVAYGEGDYSLVRVGRFYTLTFELESDGRELPALPAT